VSRAHGVIDGWGGGRRQGVLSQEHVSGGRYICGLRTLPSREAQKHAPHNDLEHLASVLTPRVTLTGA
jgi:hypothetical protein